MFVTKTEIARDWLKELGAFARIIILWMIFFPKEKWEESEIRYFCSMVIRATIEWIEDLVALVIFALIWPYTINGDDEEFSQKRDEELATFGKNLDFKFIFVTFSWLIVTSLLMFSSTLKYSQDYRTELLLVGGIVFAIYAFLRLGALLFILFPRFDEAVCNLAFDWCGVVSGYIFGPTACLLVSLFTTPQNYPENPLLMKIRARKVWCSLFTLLFLIATVALLWIGLSEGGWWDGLAMKGYGVGANIAFILSIAFYSKFLSLNQENDELVSSIDRELLESNVR